MHRGYTYYRHMIRKNGERWKCTAGCKAFLSLRRDDGNSINAVHQHNHPPPIYRITSAGRYIKLLTPRVKKISE